MIHSPRSRLARLTRAALPAAPLALVALPSAQAQIVYTPANVTLAFSDSKFLWVDMGTGGNPGAAALGPQNHYAPSVSSPSFYLWFRYSSARPEWVANDQYFGPSGRVMDGTSNTVGTAAVGSYVGLLSFGDTISGSLPSTSNYRPFRTTGTNGSLWAPGTTGFIGVKFDTNTSPLFGWAQISYNANQTLTLIDFAYESSGGSILAGAIPEPSTAALLGLGGLVAGSAALYRRRQQKKVAA